MYHVTHLYESHLQNAPQFDGPGGDLPHPQLLQSEERRVQSQDQRSADLQGQLRARPKRGKSSRQEHNDELTNDFDNTIVLSDLLAVFQGYANEVNEACDAEQGSYDAMILFTGRYNFSDVQYGYSKGLAYVGEICKM